MTAPDRALVDVIAEVLNAHQPACPPFRDLRPRCACGDWVGSELAMYTERTAHQARAVLAAISEAGTVEWGVLLGDLKQPHACKSEADARRDSECACCTLAARVTGPWTAVEG